MTPVAAPALPDASLPAGPGAGPGAAVPPDALLAVRPLSVVPEGDEFLVGDPARAEYVLLPAVGVEVLRLLQAGRSVGEAAAAIGPDVDVPDFAATLLELGFATRAPAAGAAGAAGAAADAMEPGPARPAAARARRVPPGLLRPLFGRAAWTGYAWCAALAGAIFVVRPDLVPRAHDIFFLTSPLASVAALTLLTFLLAWAHEVCHWAAARAAGLDARITVSRRLYVLAFETDLSQLWGLPRRRRYGPLLAGMAFDAVVLCAALIARLGHAEGWWALPPGASRALAALTLVQLAALVAQGYVFARTDLYAVLITATGCVNLWRVNQLRLLRLVRRLTLPQQRELDEAHPPDLAVARWYAVVSVSGVALAVGFFFVYYLPATLHLVGWLAATVGAARVTTLEFWTALLFAGVVLSPRALTVAVFVRDLRRAHQARAAARRGSHAHAMEGAA